MGENMKTKDYKRMVKLELFTLKTALFEHIYQNKSRYTHYFLVHDHSSWPTFGLHPVMGPTTLQN